MSAQLLLLLGGMENNLNSFCIAKCFPVFDERGLYFWNILFSSGSEMCCCVKPSGPGGGPTSTLLPACVEQFARVVPSDQPVNCQYTLAFCCFAVPSLAPDPSRHWQAHLRASNLVLADSFSWISSASCASWSGVSFTWGPRFITSHSSDPRYQKLALATWAEKWHQRWQLWF